MQKRKLYTFELGTFLNLNESPKFKKSSCSSCVAKFSRTVSSYNWYMKNVSERVQVQAAVYRETDLNTV